MPEPNHKAQARRYLNTVYLIIGIPMSFVRAVAPRDSSRQGSIVDTKTITLERWWLDNGVYIPKTTRERWCP